MFNDEMRGPDRALTEAGIVLQSVIIAGLTVLIGAAADRAPVDDRRRLAARGSQVGLRAKSEPDRRPRSQGFGHDRGRDASSPSEIPATGWKDILYRVYHEVSNDRVLAVAAGVTFYGLLALVPALAALVSLYGIFADATQIQQHLELLSGLVPQDVLSIIGDQVKRIASQGGGTLSLTFFSSLALSLWSSNAGVKAIFDALNIVNDEEEKRGFIKLNAQSLTFTLGMLLVLLLAMASIVVVPIVLGLLGLGGSATWLLSLLRWPLLLLIVLFMLACLYRFGPSRERPQWRWVTWGSAFAGIGWLVGSMLFSWYVSSFGNYNETYGSLGAVIAFMTWLWLSTTLVLIGAEINAEMEHQTARDTTSGKPRPMGTRGAQMADEVGKAA
jgi:membrane protein